MQIRMHAALLIVVGISLSGDAPAPGVALAQTGPSGTWRGPGRFAFVIRADGANLIGAARACGTPPIEIADGIIDGNRITFRCKSREGAPYVRTVTLTGRIQGDEIEFTWELEGDPGPAANPVFPSSRFIARRVPEESDPELAEMVSRIRKPSPVTFERILHADREPQNWLTYSGSLLGQRHSLLRQITPQNIESLKLAWLWQPQPPSAEKFEATALVENGVLYTVQPPNNVAALDADTGRVLWTYAYTPAREANVCCGRVNRGLAILGSTLFLGTLDARLLAINANTGALLWNSMVADVRDADCKGLRCYAITHAPLVVQDKVIVGTAGSDAGMTEGIRGVIAAFDATTGKEVWRFSTIPSPGEPGNDTWAGDSWRTGGAGVWMTGAYDMDLNLTYWGTGNPNPSASPDRRRGDNLYSNSVVALNADTGRLQWHYQFTPEDDMDWDAAQVPVLVNLEWEGRPRKVMLFGNKNGLIYALDRRSGELLMGTPFVEVNWMKGFDTKGRPVRVPGMTVGKGVRPYWGTNWSPASFSPSTSLFYVPAYERASGDKGSRFPGSGHGYAAVRAFDAKTGTRRWEFKRDNAVFAGGVLTTASDVLFTGVSGDPNSQPENARSADGYFYALNASTGELLWQMALPGSIHSAAMTYSVRGKQYVAVAAGNTLFAFALRQ